MTSSMPRRSAVSVPTVVRLLYRDIRRAGLTAILVPPVVVSVGAAMILLTARVGHDPNLVAVALVEAMLPLAAAIAAGSVLGADTALELQLSLPARFPTTVLRRVLLVLVWTGGWAAAGAAAVNAAGAWPPGTAVGPVAVQLTWFAPTVALCGVAFAVAAWSGGAAVSSALISAVWLVEELMPSWFRAHAWSQYVFLFPVSREAVEPARLGGNRIVLLVIGLAGFAIGWLGLRDGSRLLVGSPLRLWKAQPRKAARNADKSRAVRTYTRRRRDRSAAAGAAGWTVFRGALRHEFRMQLSKRSMWVASTLFAGLFLAQVVAREHAVPPHQLAARIGGLAIALNVYTPLIFGCLLADRLVRDRRLGMVELLNAAPAAFGPRLLGKYLGAVCACLVPLGAMWTICVARAAGVQHDATTLLYGLAAFAAIQLPAILFVGAFALACPVVLGTPLFRVLFVAYWFWGNAVPPSVLPTLSGTWLMPVGAVAKLGFFGPGGGFTDPGRSHASVLDAVGSITLLLTVALLALLAVTALEARRRTTN